MADAPERRDAFSNPVFLTPSARVGVQTRHLPHWQLDGGMYFATWRLADALPQSLLHSWMEERRAWLKANPKPWDENTRAQYRERFPQRLEQWLDAGHGSCVLRDRACAAVVADAFHFYDGDRFDLASFVVMPNHVHAVFQLRGEHQIERVLGSLKSYTALQINRKLARQGPLWQQENWDHVLRGVTDFFRCLAYIQDNPGKAGLPPDTFVYYAYPGLLPEDRP